LHCVVFQLFHWAELHGDGTIFNLPHSHQSYAYLKARYSKAKK